MPTPRDTGHTYDLQVNVLNDFESMQFIYSTFADYVVKPFQWRTPVTPIAEGIKLHLNYSHWRDHFAAVHSVCTEDGVCTEGESLWSASEKDAKLAQKLGRLQLL